MDTVHYVAKHAALCGASDARWCTIMREAVTCPECSRRLAARDRERGEGTGSAPKATP
jgi:hypothetical protein